MQTLMYEEKRQQTFYQNLLPYLAESMGLEPATNSIISTVFSIRFNFLFQLRTHEVVKVGITRIICLLLEPCKRL